MVQKPYKLLNFQHMRKRILLVVKVARWILLVTAACVADTTLLQAQNNRAIIDSLLEKLPTTTDTLRVQVLNQIAFAASQREPETSFEYAKQALELAKKIGYKRGESAALGIIGTFYERFGDYALALEYKLQALRISEQINLRSSQARSYNAIGILYFRQKRYDKALEYYQIALKLAEEQNLSEAVAVYLLNIGEVYQEMGQYDKAVEYQNKSLKISRLNPNMQDCVAFSLGIIGKCKLAEKRYKEALKNITESIRIFRAIEDYTSLAEYLIEIAKVYKYLQNYSRAIEHLQEAITISKRLENKIFEKDAHAVLAEIHALQGNFEQAFNHQRKYLQLYESIFNENSVRRISQMQTIYETEKKQAQIELLTKDNQLREKEARIARRTNYLFIAISTMTIILLAVVYRSKIQQQKVNKLLIQKNEEIAIKNAALEQQKEKILAQSNLLEEQNKLLSLQNEEINSHRNAITASITYALRIQMALLPAEEQFKKTFSDYFIFYRPRDIVSGDFYYLATVQDKQTHTEKIVLAAIDCTGHGVPGALMSMIGSTILTQIIDLQGITSPSQILSELHDKVRTLLRQDSTDNRDGMDVALCVVDKQMGILQFAGAGSDLYIFSHGVLDTIRGGRQGIGGYQTRQQLIFTEHIVNIQSSMRFYLTTDGFRDQFGGLTPKKFSSQRFKEMLLNIQHEPLSKQMQLVAQTFDMWKGTQPQTDDVLLIGWQI